MAGQESASPEHPGRFKLDRGNVREEFYDLLNNPAEENNLPPDPGQALDDLVAS